MKLFFFFFFFEGERSRQKNIYFALISYKNVKTQRHGLFVFSGPSLGPTATSQGSWGQLTGPQAEPAPPQPAGRVALALTQPQRVETIAGGPVRIPRPGLGHRKEAFSGKGKCLPDHSPGFQRPKLV